MSRLYEAIEKSRREGHHPSEPSGVDPVDTGRPSAPTPAGNPPHVPLALTFEEGAILTPKLDPCLTELVREDEPWLEQIRSLATRLRAMKGSENVQRLGLVSAIGGEGKTTLAVLLSLVLAEERGERVLLVDTDLRHREVELALGVPSGPGLSDWLKQPSLTVPLRRLGPGGPYLLGGGRPSSRPWELVSSPYLGDLFEAAAREFRYVVADCPAEGPVADVTRIQAHLDGLLLVVRARTAPRDSVLSTIEHLDENKILGVLFNAEVHAGDRFKKYRYSGYGKASKRRRRGRQES